MNYRGRQVKLMWERDITRRQQDWDQERHQFQQDILNLQNSTDAKIIENLEQEVKKKQTLLNDTINLLGAGEIKSLTDLENLLGGKTLKELIQTQENQVQNRKAEINKLAEQLDQSKEKLQFYTDNLKTKEQIISDYQKSEQTWAEFKTKTQATLQKWVEWEQVKQQKTADLETQLLNLAKQKLTNKKVAQKLVSQLEEQWTQKQADWETQSQRQQDFYATQLAQTKQEHSEILKKNQTKITELQEWSAGQHNRILELENQASVRELKLETNHRELQQKEQEWSREKQALTTQHQQILEGQKIFYLEKVSGLETQLQTNEQTISQLNQQITAQQENITNLNQQNQTSTATIRNNVTQITQLETYLNQSQQDGKQKQTQINTLNRDKLDLQARITGLIQARQKDSQTWAQTQQDQQTALNEQQKQLQTQQTKITELERVIQLANTEPEQANTSQRNVLAQLLANREEELRELEANQAEEEND